MKRIYFWMPLLLMLVMAWSCDEEENLDPVGNWSLSAPVLSAPDNNSVLTLNEAEPDAEIKFEWQPATTSNRFGVAYTFALVPEGSDDYENALMVVTPGNSGRDVFVTPTAREIDYALWAACHAPGSTVDLQWVVMAQAIEKQAIATQNVSITRFQTDYMPTTLFVTGAGAESGEEAANATPMRPRLDAEGNPTGVFDAYTTLNEGSPFYLRDQANTQSRLYGGADGVLAGCGSGITAPESGQYRVTVDLANNTYELLKINHWSLVGDAVEGGWGGDVPLNYVGDGVWQGDIEFYMPYETAGFVFRANEDWAYLLKRVVGTGTADNKGGALVMEAEAQDVPFEDIPSTIGLHTVTLDLSADGYTYSLVEVEGEGPAQTVIGESSNLTADAVSGSFDISDMDTPDAVFLLSGGETVAEFTKRGDVFTSEKYLALEASKTYTLNTSSDGSGTAIVAGDISVARDQAYLINIDFQAGKLTWKYYNMKLFHWDEVGGGWDARQELLMTYVHPYKFEVTGTLNAGFHSKFNSPWDIQFGTDSKALSGTMTNGGPNYEGIVENGTYQASIEVSDDFTTAEYSFIKQ